MPETPPHQDRPATRPGRRFGVGDLVAAFGLVILAAALLLPHVVGSGTFVGSSDRPHTVLNFRLFAVDALRAFGRIPSWSDNFLLGVPTFGLHWIVLPLDPVTLLAALGPPEAAIRLSGHLAVVLIAVAALAAYVLVRDIVASPFAAAVGAALYVCSAAAVQRIAQVEPAYALLALQPLGWLLLRRVRPGRLAATFVGLVMVAAALMGAMQLQEALYVLVFLGLYAGYRLLTAREWRGFLLLAAAGLVGLLLAAPRLGTVLEDFREVSRSSTIQRTCACELLRWFDDGIFGRSYGAARAIGNDVNLTEGLQLHSSVFAVAATAALLLRPRGGPAALAGLGFVVTLAAVAMPLTGGAEGRPWSLLLAVGLVAWALARRRLGRWAGMPSSRYLADRDLAFSILIALLAFAIVLAEPVRYLVYLAFFKLDFTHARFSLVALLPLSVLAGAFVAELFGGLATRSTGRRLDDLPALAVGAAIALSGALLLDPLGTALASLLFPGAETVIPPNSFAIPAVAIGRLAVAGAAFLVLLAANWFVRHVVLGRVQGRWSIGWRADAGPPTWPRLVPAYALGGLMVAQAFGFAYTQLSGSATRTFPIPFVASDYFTSPPDALIPPSRAAVDAVAGRLETASYRAITVSGPDGYPTYDVPSERGYASFVAMFWRLRLANGYLAMNRRVGELPWPDTSRSLRAVSFPDQTTLPWPLLAHLNVKYAIVANPSLLFNVPADPARGAEAGPEDLVVIENPLPVVPRAFFAAAVEPRTAPPPAATAGSLPPPRSIRALMPEVGSVALRWASDAGDTSFEIHRRRISPTAEDAQILLARTERGDRSFLDAGLEPNSVHEYRIRSCGSRGCGDLSPPTVARVAVRREPAPAEIALTAQSATEVRVSWGPVRPGRTVLIDLFAESGARIGETVTVPASARAYVATGLRPLGRYWVAVRACSADGCSIHDVFRNVSLPSSLGADDLAGVLPPDPTRLSVVEGIDRPLTFSASGGAPRAQYEGDLVRVQVDPAETERFLVLNELYHPRWRAYAVDGERRAELPVLPTNVVMRGLVVPPGVTEIELRFEPFLFSRWAWLLAGTGVALALAIGTGLRRLDRATPPTTG